MILTFKEMRLEEIARRNRLSSRLQKFLHNSPAETNLTFFQLLKQPKAQYFRDSIRVEISAMPLMSLNAYLKYLPNPMKPFLRERLLQLS
jgi:hypothetical protein